MPALKQITPADPTNDPDLYAVWPDGTTCSMYDREDLAELKAFMSDDFQVEAAIGYEDDGTPVFTN
jgi:hypothetical protein